MRTTTLLLTILLSVITSITVRADDTLTTADSLKAVRAELAEMRKADSIQKAKANPPALAAAPYALHAIPYDPGSVSDTTDDIDHTDLTTLYPDYYVSIKLNDAAYDYAKQHFDSLRLWLDGICFTTVKPKYLNHPDKSVVFRLPFDTLDSSPWAAYYAYPCYWDFEHTVTIHIGTVLKPFVIPPGDKAEQPKVILHTSPRWMVIGGYGLFIAICVLIIRFWGRFAKDITPFKERGAKVVFRKRELTNAAAGIVNVRQIPYSLARMQFLFWVLIIFFGIVHIDIITDNLTSPTGTVLVLLGISGGTFVLGRLLDQDPPANPTPAPAVPGGAPNPAAALTEEEEKKKKAEELENYINTVVSRNMIFDLIYDGKTMSLHRLQMVMFTTFLGIYFVWDVIYSLEMPQFSATMLALMGISSATYAGVKTMEK